MAKRDEAPEDFAEVYDLRALTAIEVGVAVRLTITESLATEYPPCKETPTEFRELLERLDVAESGPWQTTLIHCSEHGVSSKCHTQRRSEVEHVENEFRREHCHPSAET